jgi:membrane-bound lytic murein transglycosylase A
MSRRFLNFYLLIFFISFLGGCASYYKPAGQLSPSDALKKTGWWGRPNFYDDLDMRSLLAAIEKNNKFLNRLPAYRVFTYGNQKYSVKEVKESFRHFISILKESEDRSDLNYRIIRDFNIYTSVGFDSTKKVLFTGYYEPVIKGNYKKTDDYQYPIYSKPDDLIEIKLGDFRRSFKGKRIIARIKDGAVTPYHDRKSIDLSSFLSGQGLEIAWLSDPLDAFFLHIQGSGIIKIPDGSKINVNYAAANGREYRSIGRLLIKEGKIPKEMMSMKAIREYLESHPEEIERVLFHNESYIFFRVVEQGPIGSTGVPVTAGRSIASDTRIFPKGGLAFIETEIPIMDVKGNVTGWEKISRFVVDQDAGGAIKGPGRVDIFFGTGKESGKLAGSMNREGRLFFLIKKRKQEDF